eukprot:7147878-Lingulodinium_polyedra.AAC.1
MLIRMQPPHSCIGRQGIGQLLCRPDRASSPAGYGGLPSQPQALLRTGALLSLLGHGRRPARRVWLGVSPDIWQ